MAPPWPTAFKYAPRPASNPRAGFANFLASVQSRVEDLPDLRLALHEGPVGRALLLSASAASALPPSFASVRQVALPIAGVFEWKVGRKCDLIDSNTALFIEPEQYFVERHPVEGLGHAGVIVVPSEALHEELRGGRSFGASDPFNRVAFVATARSQLIAHRLIDMSPAQAALAGDELIVNFLTELYGAWRAAPARRAKAVIARAKEHIHGLGGARLSLACAAAAAGVTPIYLTQAFKASEGVPLYRYYLNIRLSEALGRLRTAGSLTELALELGFSSHSHFSAAFLARYGLTPSRYREEARKR